jgi:hypothetical protein
MSHTLTRPLPSWTASRSRWGLTAVLNDIG